MGGILDISKDMGGKLDICRTKNNRSSVRLPVVAGPKAKLSIGH